ncbi:hypothetical protein [Borreliella tanukii]|uniref:hypothetical protein n=1 Tax=Borreliella tanukii TaxID=56146 RepID=UPI0026471543|nr:hypothetical protein [Borreliella tanukii]WKC81121.1 hypothetical protein QIA29_04790 [Borreliella tanukii]
MLPIDLENQDTADSENDEEVFKIGRRAFNFINSFLTDTEIDEFITIFAKPTLLDWIGLYLILYLIILIKY